MNRHQTLWMRWTLWIVLLATAIAPAAVAAAEPESLSAEEFSRMIRDFSEEGGYFMSDNFTSSEDSYLSITNKLQELAVKNGAYIGVGPEQNFSYIAKIRPRIAFIVDIRRQAMIQHLMFKAIFQLSPTRAHFLSCLLSRPIPAGKDPAASAPVDEILALFENIPADSRTYEKNLASIRKIIQEDYRFPLSQEDQESLEYVYRSFRTWGFNIGFSSSSGRRGRGFSRDPNLREILAMRDSKGKQGSFFASAEDYDFVRGMHRRNLIIPVVGDFAGKKALASVGAYLHKRKLDVSVFYVSNVEMILLDWNSFEQFADFVENVKKLPTNDRSLFLRSSFTYYGHPTGLPGRQFCSFLQKISDYLRDFSQNRYRDYQDLIQAPYIGP